MLSDEDIEIFKTAHNVKEINEKALANKGFQGGVCNRTACNTKPANQYNHSTYAWYCDECAFKIQEFENTQEKPFKIFDKFYITKKEQ